MKKILAIALVLAMALSMSMTVFAEEAIECYSFGVMSGGPAWGAYQRGFNEACAELGWDGQYLCPTTDNNMSELFNLHDTAISNGADVMICCVTDNEAMADILQKAVEVKPGDTPEILQRRVMEQAEWLLLPQAVELVSQEIIKSK